MHVVRVNWFDSKTAVEKQEIAKEITESIARNTQTDASYIYLIFEDVKPSD
jgi:4-oxalocrotonate tautomerase